MLQGSNLPTESNVLRYWITAVLSRMFASFRASAGTMDMRLHCVGFCIYLRRFVQNECNVLQNLTSNRYLYTYQLYHKHVDTSKNLLSIGWQILLFLFLCTFNTFASMRIKSARICCDIRACCIWIYALESFSHKKDGKLSQMVLWFRIFNDFHRINRAVRRWPCPIHHSVYWFWNI